MRETEQPSSRMETFLSSFKSTGCSSRGCGDMDWIPSVHITTPFQFQETSLSLLISLASAPTWHSYLHAGKHSDTQSENSKILRRSTLTLPPHPHRTQTSSRFLTPCTMTPNNSRRLGSSIPSIFWMPINPSRRALPSCHFRLVRMSRSFEPYS